MGRVSQGGEERILIDQDAELNCDGISYYSELKWCGVGGL